MLQWVIDTNKSAGIKFNSSCTTRIRKFNIVHQNLHTVIQKNQWEQEMLLEKQLHY